jgi:hypothetical protein
MFLIEVCKCAASHRYVVGNEKKYFNGLSKKLWTFLTDFT